MTTKKLTYVFQSWSAEVASRYSTASVWVSHSRWSRGFRALGCAGCASKWAYLPPSNMRPCSEDTQPWAMHRLWSIWTEQHYTHTHTRPFIFSKPKMGLGDFVPRGKKSGSEQLRIVDNKGPNRQQKSDRQWFTNQLAMKPFKLSL